MRPKTKTLYELNASENIFKIIQRIGQIETYAKTPTNEKTAKKQQQSYHFGPKLRNNLLC